MKNGKILWILLVLVLLVFTACSKKAQPVDQAQAQAELDWTEGANTGATFFAMDGGMWVSYFEYEPVMLRFFDDTWIFSGNDMKLRGFYNVNGNSAVLEIVHIEHEDTWVTFDSLGIDDSPFSNVSYISMSQIEWDGLIFTRAH